jgi:hypothetical protein
MLLLVLGLVEVLAAAVDLEESVICMLSWMWGRVKTTVCLALVISYTNMKQGGLLQWVLLQLQVLVMWVVLRQTGVVRAGCICTAMAEVILEQVLQW